MRSQHHTNTHKDYLESGYSCRTKRPVQRVILPLPPEKAHYKYEMEAYAKFMRFLRTQPNSRMDIKVLTAIQSVAQNMEVEIDQVAKILVDLGLRAPRMAFPGQFLKFCDIALQRRALEYKSPQKSIRELYRHWMNIGDCKQAVRDVRHYTGEMCALV